MAEKKKLSGMFAPITSPFDKDGNVDLDHLGANVDRYRETGLSGFLVLGSNGEHRSLNVKEKMRVLDCVIARKAPGQAVMAGSIFESTGETIEFARRAVEAGADFITLLPPSYFKTAMSDAVLLKYFSDTADAAGKPCLIYRAPQFSGGVDLSLNLIKELAGHPNIAGIKDSAPSGIEKILFSAGEDFAVLSGSANTFFQAMLCGASGGVLSIADYLPGHAVRLFRLLEGGALEEAAALNRGILESNTAVSGAYGVGGVKAAMDMTGYYGGVPRLPLLPVDPGGRERIGQAVEKLLRDFLPRGV
ncbi:MAG: dihydrodipicolinate synthase family protein [Spirochaetaceae bacterium]|jgi:4-hydroxy-2-oxoglutarate aldolase|nr:dihydrodipicolinate synthase family protein [Spirochaetaceae bacterium]